MHRSSLSLVENIRGAPISGVAVVGASDIERWGRDWLFDCEFRQLSSSTIANRRLILDKLLWFLDERGYAECSASELRQFLAYLSSPERWGNPHIHKAAKRGTVETYHKQLRSFFSWCLSEELISRSPMERLAPPERRADQIQPFSDDEIESLLNAVRKGKFPIRDEAIIWFLLDTGARASELCSIKISDLDLEQRRVRVRGKGDKERTLFLGRQAMRTLWRYLSEDGRERKVTAKRHRDEPLFLSETGLRDGEAMTRWGLRRLFWRLGVRARLSRARICPHTFRHTFAIEFLKAGGNVFTLKELLGHTSLHMTNRYVALAQADLENQHRQFSPADHMRRNMGK